MNLAEIEAKLDEELARARAEVDGAADAEALDALERSLLGKRSVVSLVKQAIKDLPPDDRPAAGKAIAAY